MTSSVCVQSSTGVCSAGNGANVFMPVQPYGNIGKSIVIEELKNAYECNDGMVLFAIRSKLQGVAMLWVDTQPIFNNWQDFMVAFMADFPSLVNSADIQMQMMNTQPKKNKTVIEHYYNILAIGRRGQLDDNAIIKYIVNGIDDYGLRKLLLAINFAKCAELLKSLQSVASNWRAQFSKPNVLFKKNNNEIISEQMSNKPALKFDPKCYNCLEIARNHSESQENRTLLEGLVPKIVLLYWIQANVMHAENAEVCRKL
ncbi:hypothetical protein DOY81_009991 [Sarcophaga bullata]|nr:hypothetical protein DOY81_009991 [Sarcophaga bullata]